MATADSPSVEKVVAYIVDKDRLAVFVHDGEADPLTGSGLQVPAGTCAPGETAAVAVLREAWEESGLKGLRIAQYLGDAEYDMRPYSMAVHHRHFFQLAVDGPVPDEWRHLERHSGTGQPLTFRYFWLPIRQAHALAGGQGARLGSMGVP